MASITSRISLYKNKYKLSRRGKKLSILDTSKVISALPKDIPERTWAEILLKEENDLLIFDIREEILENALRIGYLHYMEKQNISFTVHCAVKAWLKLVDWFPGKVNLNMKKEDINETDVTQDYDASGTTLHISDDNLVAESEVLQKVVDYSTEKISKEESPKSISDKVSADKRASRIVRSSATGVTGGTGDASTRSSRTRRSPAVQQFGPSLTNRSKATLPPLSSRSRSRLSIISDCRLRNLRLDTQYEVSSEQIDSSPIENVKNQKRK